MHKDYQYKLALSINRNDLMENFAMALKLAIAKYWNGREVSAAQFANEFNKHCELKEEVNRETVRRWVRGDAFPEPMALALLHQWLKIDVNKIFETIPVVDRPLGGGNLKKKLLKKIYWKF
jgi:transcriptional regulator with XRE-family HTH domain